MACSSVMTSKIKKRGQVLEPASALTMTWNKLANATAAREQSRPLVVYVFVQPHGEGSNISGKLNFPVVHVGYRDAFAFCVWANKRLPTEVEWEYIARSAANGLSLLYSNFIRINLNLNLNCFETFFTSVL